MSARADNVLDKELRRNQIFSEVRGEGTPILILHGGGLDHRHMLDALEPVFESTQRWMRIYIDLPGHGRSTVDETVATQDDVLHIISSFADTAAKGQKFAVIGESRGSYHAMGLAHTRPEDLLGVMLVVADGMPGESVDWRPKHQTLVTANVEAAKNASPEARTRFARLVAQTPEILDKIEATKVPAAKLADSSLARRLDEHFAFSFDLSAPPMPFEQPSLILNGRQDAVAGYQDMLDGIEQFPRATFAILDRAGHSLAWEQPELFKALTLDWLDRMAHEQNRT
jgi:pimeloyl-ACP methyl ester carboxylesterase